VSEVLQLPFADRVKAFLTANGISQAELAKSIGYTPAVISQILSGKYAGNVEEAERRVNGFIANYKAAPKGGLFIETEQTRMMRFVAESCLEDHKPALIHGEAGMGKTRFCKEFLRERANGVYLEAVKGQTARDTLRDICAALKIAPKKGNYATFEAICEELLHSERFIIVDQAEFLTANALEYVRSIWDRTETPIILLGIADLLRVLSRRPHLYSRIKWQWELQKLSSEDVKALWRQFGVEANESLVAKTLRIAKGNFRHTIYLLENAVKITRDKEINERALDIAAKMLVIH
jgi:DNA transposition AAA+ family ATPase